MGWKSIEFHKFKFLFNFLCLVVKETVLKAAVAMSKASLSSPLPPSPPPLLSNACALLWTQWIAREVNRGSATLEYKRAATNAVKDILQNAELSVEEALPWFIFDIFVFVFVMMFNFNFII